MATQSVYSFSVKSKDTDSEKLITDLKEHCEKTGTTLSYLILKGLRLVATAEGITDGRQDS